MNEGMQNQSVGREKKCDRLRVPQSIMTASQCELTDLKLNVVEGELPDKLQGHVFIVAPVGSVDSGGLPYPDGSPIFNGDGMIYRLDFDRKGEVRITNRIAQTPCYYADQATKPGSKYANYNFQNHGLSRFSKALGVRNQLNTAFLNMRFSEDAIDRLLVTFDAGRPYEIDTESLEVVTPVGSNVEWRPEISRGFPFAPVLSTAHPVFDAFTDEMFIVNYGRSFGNFLETIPLIYEAEKLPQAIKKVLEAIARFLNAQKIVKFLLSKISQFFGCIFQFFLNLIEKIAKINLQNFVYLIRWDGVGEFDRWKLVLSDRSPVIINQSLHQIGLTRNYIILMDTAFSVGLAQTFNNPIPKHKHIEQAIRDILSRPVSPDKVAKFGFSMLKI
ncbi:hypothetical protein BCD67_02105 [Oscillatoriales cyanobacterium USR001]|nr:hypothetical protein BCD67_02105 [Oscillatoriales cyanobacterium USR001]